MWFLNCVVCNSKLCFTLLRVKFQWEGHICHTCKNLRVNLRYLPTITIILEYSILICNYFFSWDGSNVLGDTQTMKETQLGVCCPDKLS